MKILNLVFAFNVIATISFSQTSLVPVTFIIEDFDTHKEIVAALVTVRQTALTQPTLANGKVEFENVPVGEIEYYISKEEYQFETGRVNVSSDIKTNNFRISISKLDDKKILVTGEVSDVEGRDLKDAMVEVKIADQVRTGISDASGNYSLDIAPSTKFPTTTMRIEVKKGDCKKTETVDIPRTNVVYKDFKLDCNSVKPIEEKSAESKSKPEDKKLMNRVFAKKTLNEIEVRVIGFEQLEGNFKVFLEWENKSIINPNKQIYVYSTDSELQDQDSNVFKSTNLRIGNVESDYVSLIQGNISKGYIEFEVGSQKITKINLLKLYIGDTIELYNISIPLK